MNGKRWPPRRGTARLPGRRKMTARRRFGRNYWRWAGLGMLASVTTGRLLRLSLVLFKRNDAVLVLSLSLSSAPFPCPPVFVCGVLIG